MKKALFIATVYKFFNFERNDISILKGFGYEVHIATNLEADGWLKDSTSIDDLGIIKHQINFGRSPFSKQSITAYKQLKRLYEKHDFDLIHFHTPVAAALGRFALGKNYKSKIIYTCHGFHFNKKTSILSWLIYYPVEKCLSYKTNMIITINKEDYDIAKSFKSKYIEYIPGVGINYHAMENIRINKRELRKEYSFKDEDFLILIIGELSKRKNQEVVIKALKEIDCNAKLILLGDGNEKTRLENLSKKLGIYDRVFFLGQHSHEKVLEICKMADLGIIPSKIEGLGLAGLEMLASGLPVVGSNVQGIKDYVIEKKTGLLCNPNNVKEFRNAITMLINDKALYKTCVDNSKEIAKQFDISITDRLMKANYQKIISEK